MNEKEYLIKIQIRKNTRKRKDGGKFYTYSALMNLKEPNKEGYFEHWIDVKHDKKLNSMFDTFGTRGIVYCHSEDVSAPEYYVIKDKFDKNGELIEGKKEYPHVYFYNIVRYEVKKRKAVQSQFVLDEEDTEETTID